MKNFISSAQVQSGEYISLGIINVVSIPHMSVLNPNVKSETELVLKCKNEMFGLLNEIHGLYKSFDNFNDISIELLWTTEAIENQPYKAEIKLYLIARSISSNKSIATATVESILSVLKTTLRSQKYEIADMEYSEFGKHFSKVNDSAINAIIKEEKLLNLQNDTLPYCFSYDKFSATNGFEKIVNTLMNYPQSAISFQLIPTTFTEAEGNEIDRTCQLLDSLNHANANPLLNTSYLTKTPLETYSYYSANKTSPTFLFNVLVMGSEVAVTHLTTQLVGFISSDEKGPSNLRVIQLNKNVVNKNQNFYPLPWAVNETLMDISYRNYQVWSYGLVSGEMFRAPYLISSEEASTFFRLPFGSLNVSAGIQINYSSIGDKKYTDNIINSGGIVVGTLKSSANGDDIGFSLSDLAKHMLIVGTPGSGKTTFSVSLLDRLWKQHKIPFLVIEPAKNEYRALVQSIPELQVFTPGKNFISPFVFNPFVPPKNVKLETYKSSLKTAFAAAVAMASPLDKIFEEAVNNCYSNFRWLDFYTNADKGKIFNISDFIKCFQKTFDAIGYTGDAKNIGRAGVVRLKGLINLFDNYYSIPIEDLLQKPTVIELAAIENSDEKALIISLLLLSILTYVNANYIGEGGLKNVILLEEAHVLLDSNSHKGEGEADPSAIAKSLLKRMLAEIRSYGVGIIVADQSPKKVSTDVVALTDLKLAFRLVESEDKDIISGSTNMSDMQSSRLSKLKPGEAFLFFNKLDEPEEVITPDYRLENNIRISLSDENIKALNTYWDDKKDRLRPYPQCVHCTNPAGCDYYMRVVAKEVAKRIFVKNFKSNSDSLEAIENVLPQIKKLIINELDGISLTPSLFICIKIHLWRNIKYGTQISTKEFPLEKFLEEKH